jgi:hypothetical protein
MDLCQSGSVLALILTRVQPSGSPQTLILQMPPDRYGRAIQIAQAILLMAQTALLVIIAIWTSRTGSRQKIRERRAGWYHKVVVDYALPSISDFFRKASSNLQRTAAECTTFRNSSQALPLDLVVKKAVAEFKIALYKVQDDVADRAAVFDLELKEAVSALLDALEEDVTEWLDVHAFSHTRQNEKELPKLLAESQTELLKILYDFEFTQFG